MRSHWHDKYDYPDSIGCDYFDSESSPTSYIGFINRQLTTADNYVFLSLRRDRNTAPTNLKPEKYTPFGEISCNPESLKNTALGAIPLKYFGKVQISDICHDIIY